MKAHALLDELRSQDTNPRVDGGRSVIDAPVCAITDEIRTTLVEHKPKHLKLLEGERRKLNVAQQPKRRRKVKLMISEQPLCRFPIHNRGSLAIGVGGYASL